MEIFASLFLQRTSRCLKLLFSTIPSYLQCCESVEHVWPHTHLHVKLGQPFVCLGAHRSHVFTRGDVLREVQHVPGRWVDIIQSQVSEEDKTDQLGDTKQCVCACSANTPTCVIQLGLCENLQRVLIAHLLHVHRRHRVVRALYPLDQLLRPLPDLLRAQVPPQLAPVLTGTWTVFSCDVQSVQESHSEPRAEPRHSEKHRKVTDFCPITGTTNSLRTLYLLTGTNSNDETLSFMVLQKKFYGSTKGTTKNPVNGGIL